MKFYGENGGFIDLKSLTVEELSAMFLASQKQLEEANKKLEKSEKKLSAMEDKVKSQADVISQKDAVIHQKEKDIREKDAAIFKKNQAIAKKDEIIKKKEDIIKAKIEELKQCQQDLKNAKAIIKKYNLEDYKSQEDNLCFPPKSSEGKDGGNKSDTNANGDSKNKKPRKPRTTGMSKEKLESMVTGEIVIDDREAYLKEHPDAEFVEFGEPDVSYMIKKIPGRIEVIRVKRPKFKVIIGGKKIDEIVQGASPAIISGCYAHESLLADIIVSRYVFGVPIYRRFEALLEQDLDYGLKTYYNWVDGCARILKPFYQYLKKLILEEKPIVMYVDETPFPILSVIHSGKRTKCYMFVVVCEIKGMRFRYYIFSEERKVSKENVLDIINNGESLIVTDKYSSYLKTLKNIPEKHQLCTIHLRRRFADVVKILDDEKKKGSVGLPPIVDIDNLLKMEEKLKGCDAQTILETRSSDEYQACIQQLKDHIKSIKPVQGTALEKAVKYFDEGKHFFNYLSVPEAEPHTNSAERSVKPVKLYEKNSLFAASEESGEVQAIMLTLVNMAKENSLYPDRYMEVLLRKLSREAFNEEKFDKLLPNDPEIVAECRISEKAIEAKRRRAANRK